LRNFADNRCEDYRVEVRSCAARLLRAERAHLVEREGRPHSKVNSDREIGLIG